MKLRLHVAAAQADDLDLFVAVQKIDASGRTVPFIHYATYEEGPVALGWLRVSHRELDTAASTDHQPVLAHRRELKVQPGEVVPVEIEILPSGTHFEAGSTLRLVIKGRDIYAFPKPSLYMHHEDTVNRGVHLIHTGGPTDSFLLIPLVRI
jgi:predicted acyl esterase